MIVSGMGMSRCGLDLTGGRQKRQTRTPGDNPTVENFRSTTSSASCRNSTDTLEAVSSMPEQCVKGTQGGRRRGSFSKWYSHRDEPADVLRWKAPNVERRIMKV